MTEFIQFFIARICQKLIPFQSPVKKIKFKSFCDTVERTQVSSSGKTKSTEVNWYILGVLKSFSVQSGKAINYEKALTSASSPISLNIANADASLRKTNKSKPKDIIFENNNLRTDEKLHELSRGIAKDDILAVLNSLVGIPSSCTNLLEFIRIFVEHLSKEFGRVELIADSYKKFSLKREEQ